MKLPRLPLSALLSLAATPLCCIAQTSPLNGTWKADPATRKFAGTNYSLVTDNSGFTTIRGDKRTATPCTGQTTTAASGTTTTCRKTGSGYTIETTKPDSKMETLLSPDGNTLTYRVEGTNPDGAHFMWTMTDTRVSGGPGIAGEWHPVGFDTHDSGIVTIAITGDTLSLKESDGTTPVRYKLDGTEVSVPSGQKSSARLVDSHTIKVTYSFNGTVSQENTFAVTPDGQSLTETDVRSGPNHWTLTATYRRER